jgi:hypothetical protein
VRPSEAQSIKNQLAARRTYAKDSIYNKTQGKIQDPRNVTSFNVGGSDTGIIWTMSNLWDSILSFGLGGVFNYYGTIIHGGDSIEVDTIPILAFTKSQIATKQNSLGFTPENVANKSTTVTASNTLYPTNTAVINYVGAQGYGTVTAFSAGTLGALFTTQVSNATTTPALTFNKYTWGAHKFYGVTGSGRANPDSVLIDYSDIQNTPDLSGYALKSTSVTINGVAHDLSANSTYNVGTVTSLGLTGGTGITITGTSPITSAGTFTVVNTAPDQTVTFTNGTGISVTGTYPAFTVTNTSPSSGGTVTSITASSPLTGGTITTSGGIGLSTTGTAGTYGSATVVPVITTDAYGRVSGVTNTGINYAWSNLTSIPATTLTGDMTSTVTPGTSGAAILATVNTNVGNFGSATTTPTVTVNGKGLVTAVGNVTITPACTSLTGTLQAAQFPALTGDITTVAGALATTLKNTGTAGTYGSSTGIPVITTDAQGRVAAITIATVTAGGSGTVTSVGLIAGPGIAVTGTSPITTAGTFTVSIGAVSTYTITEATTFTVNPTANGSSQKVTLAHANDTVVFTGFSIGVPVTLYVKQDNTGSRSIRTWDTTQCKVMYGDKGTPRAISTTSASVDKWTVTYDGTSYFIDYGVNYNGIAGIGGFILLIAFLFNRKKLSAMAVLLIAPMVMQAQFMPAQSAKYISAINTTTVTPRAKDRVLAFGMGLRCYSGAITCIYDSAGTVWHKQTFTGELANLAGNYPMLTAQLSGLFMNAANPGTSPSTNYYLTVDLGTAIASDGVITPSGNTRVLTGFLRTSWAQNSNNMYFYSSAAANSVSDLTEMGFNSATTPYHILRIDYQNTGTAYIYMANTSGNTKANAVANIDMACNRRRSDTVDVNLGGAITSFAQASSSFSDATQLNLFNGFSAQFTTKPCRLAMFGISLTMAGLAEQHNYGKYIGDKKLGGI